LVFLGFLLRALSKSSSQVSEHSEESDIRL